MPAIELVLNISGVVSLPSLFYRFTSNLERNLIRPEDL